MNAAAQGIDVWLPWRAQPSRIPAFKFCAAWWERNGFTVHTVDSGDEPFSLAASRNHAVAKSTGPVILADADTVGDVDAIREAVQLTQDTERTVLPYTEYRSLGESGTVQALAGRDLSECSHWVYPYGVSGIYITAPQVWNSYGGQDPRFKGWLGEDLAHLHAHETLNGPIGRTQGNAYALGHESEPKTGPQFEKNRILMERYGEAAGNPTAMRALIAERYDLDAL